MKQALHKPLPHDVTLGALLVVLLVSAFLIVLPRLHALRAVPQHYYNLLPVATQTGDVDRDGIPDNVDPTPYGHRNNAVVEEVEEEEAVVECEEGDEECEAAMAEAAAMNEEAGDAMMEEAGDAMEGEAAMEGADNAEGADDVVVEE